MIGEYRRRNQSFPHESTADQFFDEGQFEAYRSLGQHIGERSVGTLVTSAPDKEVAFTELVAGFETAWKWDRRA